MVATAPADVNLQTSSAALSSSVAHSRASKGKVPALQLPARSSRMEDLRSAMLSNGCAKPVVDHALKRWVGGSNDDSYWRHWKQWCIDNNISPLADEPASVQACLAHFSRDRGFKFIEKLKVAISTFMELLYGHDASDRISNHPVIKSQLKGSKKTKPSKPRWGEDDAWDVGLIPKYWSTQAMLTCLLLTLVSRW